MLVFLLCHFILFLATITPPPPPLLLPLFAFLLAVLLSHAALLFWRFFSRLCRAARCTLLSLGLVLLLPFGPKQIVVMTTAFISWLRLSGLVSKETYRPGDRPILYYIFTSHSKKKTLNFLALRKSFLQMAKWWRQNEFTGKFFSVRNKWIKNGIYV